MIRKAQIQDAETIAGLAIQMWGEHDLHDLANEFGELINSEESACFIKYVDEKNRLLSPRFSFGTIMWKELKALRSNISKAYLCRINIAGTDMLQNYCQNVKTGQKKKAARNSPATASLIMKKA